MAVKKNIEDVQGKDNYPCGQQLLIHNGKVLKDESTLTENNVSEDGFLVVMLSKVYFFFPAMLSTCYHFFVYLQNFQSSMLVSSLFCYWCHVTM